MVTGPACQSFSLCLHGTVLVGNDAAFLCVCAYILLLSSMHPSVGPLLLPPPLFVLKKRDLSVTTMWASGLLRRLGDGEIANNQTAHDSQSHTCMHVRYLLLYRVKRIRLLTLNPVHRIYHLYMAR